MLSNTQMSLFKADMDIAEEYARLCLDPDQAKKIYQIINEEYARSVKHILAITTNPSLVGDNPALALSLERRNPYMDPLNHIQITLQKRYRDEGLPDVERDIWLDPLLRSINAIATGMRNTG